MTKKRDQLSKFLKSKNINTGIHYPIPMHLQPALKNLYLDTSLPVVEKVCKEIVSLPIFPSLKFDEIDYIIEAINEFQS